MTKAKLEAKLNQQEKVSNPAMRIAAIVSVLLFLLTLYVGSHKHQLTHSALILSALLIAFFVIHVALFLTIYISHRRIGLFCSHCKKILIPNRAKIALITGKCSTCGNVILEGEYGYPDRVMLTAAEAGQLTTALGITTTAKIMEASLPKNAQLFWYSRGLKYLIVVCIVIFAAVVFLGLFVPFLDPRHSHGITMASSAVIVAIFAVLLIFSWDALKRTAGVIAVNDFGIWYLSAPKPPTFLPWREIIAVRAYDYCQYLTLSGNSGKTIRIEYQIENFENLRSIIMKNVPPKQDQMIGYKVFRRTYLHTIVLSIIAILFGAFALWAGMDGAVFPGCLFLGFFLFAVAIWLFQPLRLIIGKEAIQLCYPIHKQSIPYSSIADVCLLNEPDRGNAIATVTIIPKKGKAIKLAGYKGGSIALYESIVAAWKGPKHAEDQCKGAESHLYS